MNCLLRPLRSLSRLTQPHGIVSKNVLPRYILPVLQSYARQSSVATSSQPLPCAKLKTPALASKKRILKKKTARTDEPNVLAYATCEEYDLEALRKGLQEKGLYVPFPLPEESNAIHARAKYVVNETPRDIFFFEEGCVVFWNFSKIEARTVLEFLRPYQQGAYPREIVEDELEVMDFRLHNGQRTKIWNGKIELRLNDSGDMNNPSSEFSDRSSSMYDGSNLESMGGGDPLEMYAFSNGIAQSVKLAIWEATLEEYITSIETLLKDIEHGRKLSVTRDHVFRKTGELFSLRHRLNLSSDLLDTPDFYWNRDDLEGHFLKTLKVFSIERRTRVMNEKIQHCQELMELVSHHLEDNHHVRLELMIIILIVVEVIFEFIHYAERFSASEETAAQ